MLPPRSAPCWDSFAKGQITGPFDLLAVQVLAMRMRIAAKRDPHDEGLRRRADEVYGFFVANAELAASDLQRLVQPRQAP